MGIKKLKPQYTTKFKKQEIEEIHKYITSIYNSSDGGYVRLFNNSTKSWLNLTMDSIFNLDNFKRAISYIGKEDAMYSLNLFNSHDTGLKNDLQAMRILAIDIDFKSNKSKYKNASKDGIIYMLEQDYFNREIPMPSIIEQGNQIRLLYVLEETVGATYNSKRLVDRVHKVLTAKLKEFGAEVQTLTSFARVPYGINTKTQDVVTVANYSNYKYTLKELQEDWLDPLPKWYKPYLERRKTKLTKSTNGKIKKNKSKVYNFFNLYTLNLARIADLEKIQEAYNLELEHDKEYLCFLYRNHCLLAGMDKETAQEKTREYYLMFHTGTEYKWRRIESQTRNVERTTYFIPTHRILEHLGITQEEEVELELTVTISKEEKRRRDFSKRKESRRNMNGLTPKQQELADLKVKLLELKDQGLNNSDIARKLTMDRKKVSRLVAN